MDKATQSDGTQDVEVRMDKIDALSSRILQITLERVAPTPSKNYVFRLLAFGALSSSALFNDIIDKGPQPLRDAANAYRTHPNDLKTFGSKYLIALGFPPAFANDLMPWG